MSKIICAWCTRDGGHRHILDWQYCEGETDEILAVCDVCWGLLNADQEAVVEIEAYLADEVALGREDHSQCWWCTRPLVYEDGAVIIENSDANCEGAALCGICATLCGHIDSSYGEDNIAKAAASALSEMALHKDVDVKHKF